jgi:hypothetical protein
MGDRRVAYRVLLGRAERKGPLGRRRRRWEDNTKNGPSRRVMKGAWVGLICLRIGYSDGLFLLL